MVIIDCKIKNKLRYIIDNRNLFGLFQRKGKVINKYYRRDHHNQYS